MKLKDQVLLSVGHMSRSKKQKKSHLVRSCMTTEVENNPTLMSCEDEPRRPVPTQPELMMGGAGPASAEPRRRITVKRPARPVERREEQQSGGGDDPDLEEPPTRRQRVDRAVVQLRALVAMTDNTDSPEM